MKVLALILTSALFVGCSKEAFQAYDPSRDSSSISSSSTLAAGVAADLCSWDTLRSAHLLGKVLVYRSESEIVAGQGEGVFTQIIEQETLENTESRIRTRQTSTPP